MRPLLLTFLAFCLGVSGASAAQRQAFVVEAEDAAPAVGEAVGDDTALTVRAGGHIIIMTSGARVIRRDGPFSGTAEELLDEAPGEAAEPLAESLLKGLVELAMESGTSEETAFGVRGGAATGAGEAGPYAIAPGAGLFCIHDDEAPAFYTPDPPERADVLVVRRITRPKELLRSEWPAGTDRMSWPADWPRPAEGRYLVSIGESGGWTVRMVLVGPRPHQALRQAALYYDAGCRRQAQAALRVAVNDAERR